MSANQGALSEVWEKRGIFEFTFEKHQAPLVNHDTFRFAVNLDESTKLELQTTRSLTLYNKHIIKCIRKIPPKIILYLENNCFKND